jgi:hypothetical protein
MQRRTRSQVVMGASAKGFSVSHPMESAGYQSAVTGLSALVDEATVLDAEQREGIIAERSGAATRRNAIDRVWDLHLPHMAAAARRAEGELPDLRRTLQLAPTKDTLAARRGAAGSMLEAVQARKDVLARYGLDEAVLADLEQALAEYDAANAQCAAARGKHVRASARLAGVGQEIVELVRILDGLYRVRLKHDEALLAEWYTLSTVRAESRGSSPGEEPSPGPVSSGGTADGSTSGGGTADGSASGGHVRPAA